MIVYTENGRGLGLGMEWVACSMRGIRRDDGSQSGVLPKQLRLALPRVDSRASHMVPGHTDGGIILEGRKRATEAAPQRRGLDRQATRDKNGALNEPGIMLRHSA